MEENRILVVEDNKDLAEAIADLLDIHGFEVDIALNSSDALKMYKKDTYDMVLMDIMLPDKNGIDSFIEIRKTNPRAKVAVMTGYKDRKLISKARENGVNNIFYKPFNVPKLLNIINNS
jgi:DNA-binding response OmpR family regulator